MTSSSMSYAAGKSVVGQRGEGERQHGAQAESDIAPVQDGQHYPLRQEVQWDDALQSVLLIPETDG